MKSIIYGCILLVSAGCNPAPELAQKIISTVDSPAAKRQVLLVRQDPGALGSLSTAVFIRDKGERELGERVLVLKSEPKIEVSWHNERHIIVSHGAPLSETYIHATKWKDVTFDFKSLP